MSTLSQQELHRYARHLVLSEVGREGQEKLRSARVVVVGVGGIGSPAAMYLAAAGLGTIGIVDDDVVDLSNLQRQLLHTTEKVGTPKVESARQHLTALNPHVDVEVHKMRLTSENAFAILEQYDVVIDGSDNFPTRYLLSDACAMLKRPNIYGSVFRFEGQVAVLNAPGGPCYRCLFPEPPRPHLVQNCAEAGVIGVLPGIIGTLQASEAVKLILGIGRNLIGRMMLFDALRTEFREVAIDKNADCAACGSHPTITRLIDYEAFCGGTQAGKEKASMQDTEMTVEQLKARLDGGESVFVLDVREPYEYEIANIGGHLIPLREVPQRLAELDPAREIVVMCHHGNRSARAADFLRQRGFRHVWNLRGGINAWAERIDPAVPRY